MTSPIESHNPYPVIPAGYLIGSYLASILYGVHVSQLYRYFKTYRLDSLKFRFFIIWIFLLSTAQILIIIATAWKYFVDGIQNPGVWDIFWWPLSIQDGLIPMMAYTAQLFFGRRAWKLLGRKAWFGVLMIVIPTITLVAGISLAVTSYLWAHNPVVTYEEFRSRTIRVPSQVVAILWLGLSAGLDGFITASLILCFWRARSKGTYSTGNSIVWRLIALTLETVLLTHICGAVMCVLFLTSPAARRTDSTAFWIFLEVITELYALSLLFTINSRTPGSTAANLTTPVLDYQGRAGKEASVLPTDSSVWDRAVEGPSPPTSLAQNAQEHYELQRLKTDSSNYPSSSQDMIKKELEASNML